MTLIDRHILREWFAILGLVLAATLGLLLMNSLYGDLEDLLEVEAGLGDILFFFAVKVPGFFAVVFPLVLLVSLLYTLGKLHYGNEITAMRAAGMGLFRITRSIWITGVFFCGLVWVLNATVVPWSVEESRRIVEGLQLRQELRSETASMAGQRTAVTFDNRLQGRMWFFNRYSPFSQRGAGVTVLELDGERREKTRILAREAWYDAGRGYWVFRDGREIWTEAATGEIVRTMRFAEKAVPHFRDDPALMTLFDVKPDHLSIFELRRLVRHYRMEDNPRASLYAMRYYLVMAETLGPLIIIAIAVPFAVAGVRVNPAVGVSKSLGLFVLYFLILKVATALGTREIVAPLWAALMPNLAMLGVGLVAFFRVR